MKIATSYSMPFAAVLVLSLLVSCDTSSVNDLNVVLQVDRTSYEIEDSANLAIVNLGDMEVEYNLCDAILEHYQNRVWTPVPSEGACFRIAYGLPPGETGFYEKKIIAEVQGTYRYSYRLYLYHENTSGRDEIVLYSPTFVVSNESI